MEQRSRAHGNLKMFMGIKYPETCNFGLYKPFVEIFAGIFHNPINLYLPNVLVGQELAPFNL